MQQALAHYRGDFLAEFALGDSAPFDEWALRYREQLHQRGGAKCGSVERISLEERTIDIKKRKDTASTHPEAVFSHNVIGTTVLAEALAAGARA